MKREVGLPHVSSKQLADSIAVRKITLIGHGHVFEPRTTQILRRLIPGFLVATCGTSPPAQRGPRMQGVRSACKTSRLHQVGDACCCDVWRRRPRISPDVIGVGGRLIAPDVGRVSTKSTNSREKKQTNGHPKVQVQQNAPVPAVRQRSRLGRKRQRGKYLSRWHHLAHGTAVVQIRRWGLVKAPAALASARIHGLSRQAKDLDEAGPCGQCSAG